MFGISFRHFSFRRKFRLLDLTATLLAVVWAGEICAQQPARDLFPPELVKFVPYKVNPVFNGAGKGHWDELIRERGWIIRENGLWKLWYTGYEDKPGHVCHLGYATSPDGITWTRHPKNPLYTKHWVEDMMVVKHQGKYWMFCEGEPKGNWPHLLVSDNGLDWTWLGPLDISLKNGKPIPPDSYGTPTAWLEDGTWYLFYERRDLDIWLAASKDMKVWTNVQDQPVMKPGPGEYDKDLIALNQIIKYKGRYYAYYHGCAVRGPRKGLWSTAVAVSSDLRHWKKYPGNPLQPVVHNKDSGIVIHDGHGFRLYTMHSHPGVSLHIPAGATKPSSMKPTPAKPSSSAQPKPGDAMMGRYLAAEADRLSSRAVIACC